MTDGFSLWLLLLGLVVGVTATWLLTARLARRDADVSLAERTGEAAWIAATIEREGGVAPTDQIGRAHV